MERYLSRVPGTAERVARDAQVTVVGIDSDGQARDIGSERRFFTWTQRLAMIGRDGNCWRWCDRRCAPLLRYDPAGEEGAVVPGCPLTA